ncbi:MAG: hypothetical protein QG608_1580 [Actinomycetota bacterium]|nr:hypothetical protein [Actinomycetota bacterium]
MDLRRQVKDRGPGAENLTVNDDRALSSSAEAAFEPGRVSLLWMLAPLACAHAGALPLDLSSASGTERIVAAGTDGAVAFLLLVGLLALLRGVVPRKGWPVPLLVTIAAVGTGTRMVATGEPLAGADIALVFVAALATVSWPEIRLVWAAAFVAWGTGLAFASEGLSASWWTAAALGACGLLMAVVLQWAMKRYRWGIEEARTALLRLSVIDPLTGIPNRKGLDMLAEPMIENARRQGQAVHCLFVDVDGFREINERLGRRSGDVVLEAVSEALKASVRTTDIVSRWAGDQFAVVGPGTGTSPLELERRARSRLENDLPVPREVWPGRLSVGSATLVPWDDGDLESMLNRADQDMQLRRSLRRQSRERALGQEPGASPGSSSVSGRWGT